MSKRRYGGATGPVACVLLPHFPWQAELRRNPDLKNRPAIIIDAASGGSGRTVLDWSHEIEGVLPGMPLAEALSRNKGALIIEPDTAHYEVAFGKILKALEERCPDVEDDGLGRAYVGIWGLEGLYGDDARVVQTLANAVRQYDLRIGVGDNKWLSYVAAVQSKPGSGRKVSGDPGRFLSQLEVDTLPVDYRVVQRLHSFGLHHLGDVAGLPEGALQAQFGPEGNLAWQLANGFDSRPLVSRRSEEIVSDYLMFPDATVSMPTIVSGIESLLSLAYARPQLARRYARQAVLESKVFRRSPWTMRTAFKDPAGSKHQALFGIKAKLDTVEIPGPLEDLRITLSGLTGEAGRQESMWTEVKRSQQMQDAISQLQARLGMAPPIYKVRELEPWSRIPERRHALVQLSS